MGKVLQLRKGLQVINFLSRSGIRARDRAVKVTGYNSDEVTNRALEIYADLMENICQEDTGDYIDVVFTTDPPAMALARLGSGRRVPVKVVQVRP